MDLGLSGRTALVAGGSAGIGKAIAAVLAQEGAKVAIISRSKKNLDEATRQITSIAAKSAFPFVCDVTKKSQIEATVKRIEAKLGVVSILICNAGGPPLKRFEQIGDREWDDAYNLNLKSTIRLVAAVLPKMKAQKWGRIISITSISALQASESLMLSSAIRPGVHGLTKALSNELAPFGITANVICPGYTSTERLNELADAVSNATGLSHAKVYAQWKSNVPAGRLAKPEEIGYLAAFIASDKAAYLTGVALNIDGGFVKTI